MKNMNTPYGSRVMFKVVLTYCTKYAIISSKSDYFQGGVCYEKF